MHDEMYDKMSDEVIFRMQLIACLHRLNDNLEKLGQCVVSNNEISYFRIGD